MKLVPDDSDKPGRCHQIFIPEKYTTGHTKYELDGTYKMYDNQDRKRLVYNFTSNFGYSQKLSIVYEYLKIV